MTVDSMAGLAAEVFTAAEADSTAAAGLVAGMAVAFPIVADILWASLGFGTGVPPTARVKAQAGGRKPPAPFIFRVPPQ